VIVIDELHAFLEGTRGLHLSSLLSRIEGLSAAPVRKVALSATLPDFSYASAWLSPRNPQCVRVIASKSSGAPIELHVRGYVDAGGVGGAAIDQLVADVFSDLRGSNNLLFASSRGKVESLSDRLAIRSRRERVPLEFYPYHSSLARPMREAIELRFRRGELPTTAVTTSALDLGIHIGSVESVAQLGAPRSITALKQRLGRSGRSPGRPSILRLYVPEKRLDSTSSPLDQLRTETVMAVAATRLLRQGYLEPPKSDPSYWSVVFQQTLSMIVERGGAHPDELHCTLKEAAPFRELEEADYHLLLESLREPNNDILEVGGGGKLMLGAMGERITSSREFCALFPTPKEWQLVGPNGPIGTMPLINQVTPGTPVLFAGQGWVVDGIDSRGKRLKIRPHPFGVPPLFAGSGPEPVSDRLAEEMRVVYEATDVPGDLNSTAAECLEEGRAAYRRFGLGSGDSLDVGTDCFLFLWRGTEFCSLLSFLLRRRGVECASHGLGITIKRAHIARTLDFAEAAEEVDWVGIAEATALSKYDQFVPPILLKKAWANRFRHLEPELQLVLRQSLQPRRPGGVS
jgi:ATP-dependent Lhr-like helicase